MLSTFLGAFILKWHSIQIYSTDHNEIISRIEMQGTPKLFSLVALCFARICKNTFPVDKKANDD